MAREPLPTWYFALVVVRRADRFLLTKTTADHESLGAAYLSLDEIRARPLRGSELVPLLESVAQGCPVFPLELLGRELLV